MKTLHLHIGSPKTGTTSIQNTFHMNRKILNKLGFNYPGEKRNHHYSYYATSAPFDEWPRRLQALPDGQLSRKVEQYFSSLETGFKADFKHQIMSTEYLFTVENEQYVNNYLSYLNRFFSEIKIYVFVRDPIDYYKSIQQQVIKARSYLTPPQSHLYNFKDVIEAWQKFYPIEVIEYIPGLDSCKVLSDKIGIDYKKLSKTESYSNTSLSIQQIALLEKLQVNLYREKDSQLKPHFNKIRKINAPSPYSPILKSEVKSLIQKRHREDLEWLRNEFGIDFIKNFTDEISSSTISNFKEGKATVRDIYQINDERIIEQYEAFVIDTLLKNSVQGHSKLSIFKKILKFLKSLIPRI